MPLLQVRLLWICNHNQKAHHQHKGGGIGACKGSPPENFVAELRSLEKAKVEAQREAKIRKNSKIIFSLENTYRNVSLIIQLEL